MLLLVADFSASRPAGRIDGIQVLVLLTYTSIVCVYS